MGIIKYAAMSAALAFGHAGQAQAADFILTGTETGTSFGQASCPGGGLCATSSPFTAPFSLYLSSGFLTKVADVFSFDYGTTFNHWSGSFRLVSPTIYEPISVNHATFNFSCFSPGYVGLCGTNGSSTTFSIVNTSAPPVPEPMTWTLLITGFAAIAYSMRRRVRFGRMPSRAHIKSAMTAII